LWVRDRRYRFSFHIERWQRAWHYATHRVSADDAQRMMLDCRYPAGWHPLLVLTVEDTLEQAREDLADHPDLPRLLADGCARVGDKWESFNDELWEARRWAIDLAKGYAADEGITLTALDGEREPAS
jgi:hypothetical protein